jgi:hypothetical protein
MQKDTGQAPEIAGATGDRLSVPSPSNIDAVAARLARLIGRQMAREHFQRQHHAAEDEGIGRE